MRLALTVVSPAARQSADVILDAAAETPVAEVAAALERFAHGGVALGTYHGAGQSAGHTGAQVLEFPGSRSRGPTALADPGGYSRSVPLYVDYQRVPPALTLAASAIRDGSVISLGGPEGCVYPEPTGLAEVRVAGGPGAGAVHRLGIGEADIGGGQGAAIRVADPDIPGLALRVSVGLRGECQVTPYPGVTVTLDREPLIAATEWRPGQQVAVGGTLLDLAPYEPPDAALHPAEDGAGLEFNRPPRLLPPDRVTRFQLPSPPSAEERRPLPVLMAVVPVMLGVAMAYFLRQVYMLAMAAFSPVMLLGSHCQRPASTAASPTPASMADYREHKARIERDAGQALEAERIARRARLPGPRHRLSIATGPRRRLWERRRTDPDYLLLRAGTADLPSAVELSDPSRRRAPQASSGRSPTPRSPFRWPSGAWSASPARPTRHAASAAGWWPRSRACTAPGRADLRAHRMPRGRTRWEWVRWLPHCRPATARTATALVGNDAETVAARIAEPRHHRRPVQGPARVRAVHVVRCRRPDRGPWSSARFEDDIVVVFDGSRRLRSLPGAIQVLREGPGSACTHLPGRGRAAAARRMPGRRPPPAPDGTLRVQQMMAETIRQARPEHVSPGWAPGWPGRSRRSGTSATTMTAPGCPTRPGCWTCSAGAAHGGGDHGPVEGRRPVHASGDRGVLRRAVRDRPAQGRAARAGRRHHRGRQVRAAADPDRVAGRSPTGRMR